MKLLNNIDKHNSTIQEISDEVDSLLITEGLPILGQLARWWFSRKAREAVFGDGEEKDEEAVKKARKKLKKRIEDEKLRTKDVDNVVDDIQQLTGTDKEANEELRALLHDIVKKQEAIVDDILDKDTLRNITVSFSEPVNFTLKRGKEEGKELRLEGTKTYEVFNVEKKLRGYKIYFIYKTRSINWLRQYSIMFSMKLKSIKTGVKQDGVTVNIAYVNETLAKDYNYKIIEEKPLTHRAMVEIKSSR
tara:strand:- start:1147 stop:1887 length:741 start_codon:yes stop_codon:yes gene_type:complete